MSADTPVRMRAACVVTTTGPEDVRVLELPEPEPGPGQVVVDVRAAGISYPDVLLSQGRYQYRPEPPFAPGAEVAGVIRSAPEGARVRPGDRVAAFTMVGGLAEVVAVDADLVLPIPDSLDFVTAAALPMNYLTCHFALRHRGALQSGETVLVHGAAGGIGSAAVQLASLWGARVLAVVSDAGRAETARRAGAAEVLLADGFLDTVRELTGGTGVDVVVDPVGGDRFTDSCRALRATGRILVVGFTGGEIPTVRVNRLLLSNTSVVGVGWGAFWADNSAFVQRQWQDLRPLVDAGALRPEIATVEGLETVSAALVAMSARASTGKTVVVVR
jgi:NADPH:quinone reductase